LRCKSRLFSVTCKRFLSLFFKYSSYQLNFKKIMYRFFWHVWICRISAILFGKNQFQKKIFLVYK
jgi:hypothetical protein